MLGCRVEGGRLADWQRVFCAALRSPRGNLTLAVVDDAPVEFNLKLHALGRPTMTRLFRYQYGEAEQDWAEVKVNPQREFSLELADALRDTLPANSLTVCTTYKLEHDAPGVIAEMMQSP